MCIVNDVGLVSKHKEVRHTVSLHRGEMVKLLNHKPLLFLLTVHMHLSHKLCASPIYFYF